LLDDPAHDRVTALRRQRELVARDLERLGVTARAIDVALDAHENGTVLKESAMLEGFDPTEYEEEVRERWGDTEAYQESTRRAASHGKAQWQEIKAEADQIVRDFADLLRAGEPADGERAQAVAERHRRSISRWFYPCSAEMHRCLGDMYVADQRFARNYEQVAEGLTAYVRVACSANADALGALSS
jgi:MerR family transcriptional regulator, thiopeptide resistance regulator